MQGTTPSLLPTEQLHIFSIFSTSEFFVAARLECTKEKLLFSLCTYLGKKVSYWFCYTLTYSLVEKKFKSSHFVIFGFFLHSPASMPHKQLLLLYTPRDLIHKETHLDHSLISHTQERKSG